MTYPNSPSRLPGGEGVTRSITKSTNSLSRLLGGGAARPPSPAPRSSLSRLPDGEDNRITQAHLPQSRIRLDDAAPFDVDAGALQIERARAVGDQKARPPP